MPFPTHIVAVAGLVEDGTGNVLLVKTHFRGWEIPGGQVEIGENFEEALKREIREESGVEVSIRCLVGIYSNVQAEVWRDGKTQVPTKIMFDFLCDYTEGELHTSDETCDVKWVPKEQVLSMITHPVFCERIQNILTFDGRVLYSAFTKKPEYAEQLRRYF